MPDKRPAREPIARPHRIRHGQRRARRARELRAHRNRRFHVILRDLYAAFRRIDLQAAVMAIPYRVQVQCVDVSVFRREICRVRVIQHEAQCVRVRRKLECRIRRRRVNILAVTDQRPARVREACACLKCVRVVERNVCAIHLMYDHRRRLFRLTVLTVRIQRDLILFLRQTCNRRSQLLHVRLIRTRQRAVDHRLVDRRQAPVDVVDHIRQRAYARCRVVPRQPVHIVRRLRVRLCRVERHVLVVRFPLCLDRRRVVALDPSRIRRIRRVIRDRKQLIVHVCVVRILRHQRVDQIQQLIGQRTVRIVVLRLCRCFRFCRVVRAARRAECSRSALAVHRVLHHGAPSVRVARMCRIERIQRVHRCIREVLPQAARHVVLRKVERLSAFTRSAPRLQHVVVPNRVKRRVVCVFQLQAVIRLRQFH